MMVKIREKQTEQLEKAASKGLKLGGWKKMTLSSKIAAVVLVLVALTAILAPLLAPYSPVEIFTARQAPGNGFIFGTDDKGRDILSRMLYGGRYSLIIGFGATAMALVCGSVVGALAAVSRKAVSETIMRILDIIMSIPGIALAAVFVSILGHLDGNSPTTYLIVIPAMAPLCKKLNIRISTIMMVCTATITVMNLVPWGGVLNRQSITLAMDSNELCHMYLPLQVCGLVCCVGLAVIMARVEVKRGAGKIDVSATQEEESEVVDKAAAKLLRPKLLWYNVLLTVVVFVLLFTTKLPNYFIFMLGCVFALVVNFPDPKEQEARLAAHAPKAISLVATVLAAGVMVGILNNTGMIVAMAEFIINILPAALAKHLHLVFAFLGGFIGLAVSPDPLYYGILPVLIEVCGNYGIPATSVAIAFGVGADSCFTMAPVIASTYLGLAVSGMSLKDVMKTNFLPHWIIGLIMIVFGCSFSEALEVVRSSSLFTTHTPVPAGHDAFPESMIRQYMSHYPDVLGITWEQYTTPRLPFKVRLISKRFPYPLGTRPSPSRSTPTDTSATVCRKTQQPRWKNSFARCKKRRLTRIAVFRGYRKEVVCGYGVGIQQHKKSRNPCISKNFGSWSIADSNFLTLRGARLSHSLMSVISRCNSRNISVRFGSN